MTAFTPEEIRAFLAENVTVVAPGETLVIRVDDLTPNQMREWQESLDRASGDGRIPFRCLVVYGDGLGVVREAPEPLNPFGGWTPAQKARFWDEFRRELEIQKRRNPRWADVGR